MIVSIGVLAPHTGESKDMALPTPLSRLDGAGGNSEADIRFSPLLASLFTGAGTC